jgi:hypothetical protein
LTARLEHPANKMALSPATASAQFGMIFTLPDYKIQTQSAGDRPQFEAQRGQADPAARTKEWSYKGTDEYLLPRPTGKQMLPHPLFCVGQATHM